MKERERLLWGVLIILLLIIAVYEGYHVYQMGRQVRVYQEAMEREALGSEDPQLRTTIEQLEIELRDRMGYEFTMDEDPLDLTQVIHGKKFLAKLGFSESLENQNTMRLSCTVMGANPVAVVKFQGRSRILRVGDKLDAYKVTVIERNRVTLRSSVETLELVTQKSPETLEKEKEMQEGTVSVSIPEDNTEPGNY
ncbi:hypothetical protein KJ564_09615 [bacterium]|nr:hypothetical protein [bacterium]